MAESSSWDGEVTMSLAAAAHGRPSAPQNGEYHRMEDQDYTQRFKNRMRMQLFGDTAILEYPRHKNKKSYTLSLIREDEVSCGIDWTPVDPSWQTGRLQFAEVEGVEGMLEDGGKFWKLHEEYSAAEVARRMSQRRSRSPAPALMDGVDAEADASTIAHPRNVRPRSEQDQQAQQRRGPREWLDENPGDAGSWTLLLGAGAGEGAGVARARSGSP